MGKELRTEDDVRMVLGEAESIVLEFKGPDDFDSWPDTRNKLAQDLSKQVSAFANTYGGQIVLGVREAREKPRKATEIVGIDPTKPPVEHLQSLVDSNVRPRIEGVRYRSIALSGARKGRVVYVIAVPQGTTVYQAKDKLYYGRREFQVEALEDQLIRYKMLRDRIAAATVEMGSVKVELSVAEYDKRQERLNRLKRGVEGTSDERGIGPALLLSRQRKNLEKPARSHDEYAFSLAVRNTGALSILDCQLSVTIDGSLDVVCESRRAVAEGNKWVLRFAAENRTRRVDRFGQQEERVDLAKLFPEETRTFPGAEFKARVPAGARVPSARLAWVLYLENSPRREGELDLGNALAQARTAEQAAP